MCRYISDSDVLSGTHATKCQKRRALLGRRFICRQTLFSVQVRRCFHIAVNTRPSLQPAFLSVRTWRADADPTFRTSQRAFCQLSCLKRQLSCLAFSEKKSKSLPVRPFVCPLAAVKWNFSYYRHSSIVLNIQSIHNVKGHGVTGFLCVHSSVRFLINSPYMHARVKRHPHGMIILMIQLYTFIFTVLSSISLKLFLIKMLLHLHGQTLF